MTTWFNRTAGEGAPLGHPSVDQLPDDPNALLIHSGIPDWIKNPMTGDQERVTGTEEFAAGTPCPHCHEALPRTVVLIATCTVFPTLELLAFECAREKLFIVASRKKA